MRSPVSRSKAYLQEMGYVVDVCERYNHFSRTRNDLFGFADMVGLAIGHIVAVQTTSGSNAAARVTKIVNEPRSLRWIQAGGKILVLTWSKRGPRGQRKVWTPKERWVTVDDFMSA